MVCHVTQHGKARAHTDKLLALLAGDVQQHIQVGGSTLTWNDACMLPVEQSQTRARPSPPSDAAVLPSGLTVMPRTLPACVGAVVRLCAARSHTMAVASMLAVTANLRTWEGFTSSQRIDKPEIRRAQHDVALAAVPTAAHGIPHMFGLPPS